MRHSIACRIRLAILLGPALLLVAACTADRVSVVPVPVQAIDLSVSQTSLFVGGSTSATATPRSADGDRMTARSVSWTTSNPAMLSVEGSGTQVVLRALAPGSATITATSEGKSAAQQVTVAAAIIQLADTSLRFTANQGQSPSPDSQLVGVTAGNAAPVTGLSVDAVGTASSWLSAKLSGTTAPATLSLRVSSAVLAPGTYSASVTVRSSLTGVQPKALQIVLVVNAASITPSSTITTVAGTGRGGSSGFGGPAIAANLDIVTGLRTTPDGAFYVSIASSQYYPYGHVLRVGTDGTVQNLAGDGQASSGSSAGCYGDGGPAIKAKVNAVLVQAIAADGTIYIYDGGDCAYERKITSDGIIHGLASLTDPGKIAIAPDGTFYLTYQPGNYSLANTIQRLNLDGTLTRVAGTGAQGSNGDGGPALQATFSYLWAVALGADSAIYVSDGGCLIRRIDRSGTITRFAGTGVCGYSGDGGPATAGQLGGVYDIAFGADRALYIADMQNNVVRRVGTDGILTTVVGTGTAGSGGDGGPAGKAQLNWPSSLSFATDGALLVGEFFGRRVRRIK